MTCPGRVQLPDMSHAVTVRRMWTCVRGTQDRASVTLPAENITTVALIWTIFAQEKVCFLTEEVVVCLSNAGK